MMFKNSLGQEVYQEEPIFPLFSCEPNKKMCKCIGTGFFIHGQGVFVTAKHIFIDNLDKRLSTLYAIQTTSKGDRHIRPVKYPLLHPKADIAVGLLGESRLPNKSDVQTEIAAYFKLNFSELQRDDKIKTYAFPLSQTEELKKDEFEFTFGGKWSYGTVVNFYKNGVSLLKNKCYQTTMAIEHGASGGPVLKDNLVVGVNSTGWDVLKGEAPISFITPIDLILELSVRVGDRTVSFKELIENKVIKVK